MKGDHITQIATDAAETNNGPPLKAYDIRHVSKDENSAGSSELLRVRNRCRFKKAAAKPKDIPIWIGSGDECGHEEFNRSTSHDSSLSHLSEASPNVEGESLDTESLASVETGEGSGLFRNRGEAEDGTKQNTGGAENGEIELELSLGFQPVSRSRGVGTKKSELYDGRACKMELVGF